MRYISAMVIAIIVLTAIFSGGLSAHAERPDAPPYAERGDYAVGTREYTVDDGQRPFHLTIWYLTDNPDDLDEEVTYQEGIIVVDGEAILDAPPSEDAPFPLVVFSHGSGGTRFQSTYLMEHLASWGFVVMAGDHMGNTAYERAFDPELFESSILTNFALRPLDVLRIIDFADALAADDDEFAGTIDMEQIAIAGHSFGGYTTLALGGGRLDFGEMAQAECPEDMQETEGFCVLDEQIGEVAHLRGLDEVPDGEFPSTTDPRVKAIVMMAPALAQAFSPTSLEEIAIPSMTLIGTADDLLPDAQLIDEHLPENTLVEFENGGHFIYVDACSPLAIAFNIFPLCSDAVWDMERAHDIIDQLTTAFLLSILKNDSEAAAALAPEAVDYIGVDYQP